VLTVRAVDGLDEAFAAAASPIACTGVFPVDTLSPRAHRELR
jgi:hypothetical protein